MKKLTVISRTVGVLSAVTILGAGVTYASLTTTATLTANSFASATAGLLVDGSDDGATPSASEAGFSFANVLPGAGFGAAQTFSLKNDGTSNLKVTVYAIGGTQTGIVDESKVHFEFTNTANDSTKVYTLAQMKNNFNDLPGISGIGESLGVDDATTTPADEGLATFEVRLKMDEAAVAGGSASLNGFNMVFTGTAVAAPVPEAPVEG